MSLINIAPLSVTNLQSNFFVFYVIVKIYIKQVNVSNLNFSYTFLTLRGNLRREQNSSSTKCQKDQSVEYQD